MADRRNDDTDDPPRIPPPATMTVEVVPKVLLYDVRGRPMTQPIGFRPPKKD
mgnify:CR=1 FL=1